MPDRSKPRLVAPLLAVLALPGCQSSPVATEGAPSAAAPQAREIPRPPPIPSAERKAALNPSGEKPYAGPVGGVRGTVRVSGPPAPEQDAVLAQVPPAKCDDGRAFYRKLFREGPGRELGDVLVAVTGYKGYLPPASESKLLVARGCAFESRTVAMVFGQELLVKNRGPEAFMPLLENSGQLAMMVALPGGEPVRLYPSKVGQYRLIDQSHPFATADVFVLKYPTFDVTGLDGEFSIEGIPVGDVVVSAYLPVTRQTATERVVIESGKTAVLNLTLPFLGVSASPPQGAEPAPNPGRPASSAP